MNHASVGITRENRNDKMSRLSVRIRPSSINLRMRHFVSGKDPEDTTSVPWQWSETGSSHLTKVLLSFDPR